MMNKRLVQILQYAFEHSYQFKNRIKESEVDINEIKTINDLEQIPILKKEDLPELQKIAYPFGEIATVKKEEMARIFMSPGPIYDPQTDDGDYFRFSEALMAAGFTENDIVQNTFSYHLSPAGFMFDSALRKLKATVIPAGVGNRELQIQIMKDLQVTGYVGTPSFLVQLLELAEEKGWEIGRDLSLTKAFFTAEKLTDERRQKFEEIGISVYEGYGTADVGCIAYEDAKGPGLKLASGAIVQICDPISGKEVMDTEGEVVVTLLDEKYPLIRFGTGDLSCWVKGHEGSRITGILGRVGSSVKVKGMFVHERQLTDILQSLGILNYQAVVTDKNGNDHFEIFVETDETISDITISKIKDVIRVTPIVTKVENGSINKGQKKLVDEREWKKSIPS